jgi:hypothetical protein
MAKMKHEEKVESKKDHAIKKKEIMVEKKLAHVTSIEKKQSAVQQKLNKEKKSIDASKDSA